MQFMQTREYAVGKRYADSSLLILGQGMNRFCALWNEQYTQNKIPTKFLTLVKESIAADKRNSRFTNKCRDKSLSQMAAGAYALLFATPTIPRPPRGPQARGTFTMPICSLWGSMACPMLRRRRSLRSTACLRSH